MDTKEDDNRELGIILLCPKCGKEECNCTKKERLDTLFCGTPYKFKTYYFYY